MRYTDGKFYLRKATDDYESDRTLKGFEYTCATNSTATAAAAIDVDFGPTSAANATANATPDRCATAHPIPPGELVFRTRRANARLPGGAGPFVRSPTRPALRALRGKMDVGPTRACRCAGHAAARLRAGRRVVERGKCRA